MCRIFICRAYFSSYEIRISLVYNYENYINNFMALVYNKCIMIYKEEVKFPMEI